MALIDKKLTDLTEKLSVPDDAFIHIVDVSDTSQSPDGSSYKARKSTISGTVKAQTGVSGTVKTNSNSSDPIVYLKSEVDALVAGKQNALGFTPENVANKQSNLDEDLSGLKYPTVTAVKSGLSTKADITALNLKADKSNTYTKLEVDNLIEEVDLSTKEDSTNKQNSLAVDGTGVKFPTVDAVNAGLSTKISGSGTTNFLPKFGADGTIGNSSISDNGTLVSTNLDILSRGFSTSPSSNNRLAAQYYSNFVQGGLGLTSFIVGRSLASQQMMEIGFAYDLTTPANSFFHLTPFGSSEGGVFKFGIDGNMSVVGNITTSPATLPNQVVVKSQLDLKADLASPSLTGTPTAPPPTTPTGIANKSYVDSAITTADSGNVKTTGDQIITGTKTFTNTGTTSRIAMNTQVGATLPSLFLNNQSGATVPSFLLSASTAGVGGRVTVTSGTGIGISFESNQTGSGGASATMLNFDNVLVNNDITPLRVKRQGTEVLKIDHLGAITSSTLAGTGTRLVAATPTGQLTINNSALLYTNQTITANKTVTVAEFVNNNELILSVNATSGNITITLPTFTALQGYKVTVKKMDSSANSVLITGVGGVNIDGSASVIISGQYSSSTVGANLSQYIIL